jgi:translocator protein
MLRHSTPARAPAAAIVLIVLATLATAAIGAYASIDAKGFYASLTQPPWAPPAAVFGPVWTVLYLMMAGAAWLSVRTAGLRGARPALLLYGTQLVLNALWTWLFFRWHQGAFAFAEVLLLLAFVVATAVAFGRIRALAGWLLVPYIAWVAFASALTLSMWRLNPGVL